MTRRTTEHEVPILPGYKRGDISRGFLNDDGSVTLWLQGHDLQYTVRYATGDNGPYATALRVGSVSNRPISSDDLRSIPLQRLALAAARLKDVWRPHEADNDTFNLWADPEGGRATRKRGVTDELLRDVSERARFAFRRGDRVRETLAEHFHVSPFTVDKWLAKARDAGHLQAGELSRKRK